VHFFYKSVYLLTTIFFVICTALYNYYRDHRGLVLLSLKYQSQILPYDSLAEMVLIQLEVDPYSFLHKSWQQKGTLDRKRNLIEGHFWAWDVPNFFHTEKKNLLHNIS